MATIKKEMEIIWHTADEIPTNYDARYILLIKNSQGSLTKAGHGTIDCYYDPDGEYFRTVYNSGMYIDYERTDVEYWAVEPDIPFPGA